MKDLLYQLLGVKADASAADIKVAYRTRSKLYHPDVGGDPEAFKRLVLAYEILSNKERRAKYDATGVVDDTSQLEDQIRKFAIELINRMLYEVLSGQEDFGRQPVLQMMVDGTRRLQQTDENKKGEHARIRTRAEKLAKRFKRKGKGTGPSDIESALAWQVYRQNHEIEKLDKQLAVYAKAIEILENHEYEMDAPPPQLAYTQSVGGVFFKLGGVEGSGTGAG